MIRLWVLVAQALLPVRFLSDTATHRTARNACATKGVSMSLTAQELALSIGAELESIAYIAPSMLSSTPRVRDSHHKTYGRTCTKPLWNVYEVYQTLT